MVLQEDLDFLAHHGVKGMHWGVRKKRNSHEGVTVKSRPKKTIDRKKVLAVGATVAAGAAIAGIIIAKKGHVRASEVATAKNQKVLNDYAAKVLRKKPVNKELLARAAEAQRKAQAKPTSDQLAAINKMRRSVDSSHPLPPITPSELKKLRLTGG